jgi:hypothetical protein
MATMTTMISRNHLPVLFALMTEAAFHRSDHLFSCACSVVEEADGWDWQAAASWTVTAMVDTLNWEGSDVDGDPDTHDDSQPHRQSPHNQR